MAPFGGPFLFFLPLPPLFLKMSDFYETTLRRYEEEQDQLVREEYEREQNPVPYWHVVTTDRDDYADSEEEAAELIQQATMAGIKYSCTQHIKGVSYQ